jgi:predicted nucleotide-binding protein
VAFSDPWTPQQETLVNTVFHVWSRTKKWPTFQYVAAEMEDKGLDAVQLLRSFPTLGQRGGIARVYADVNFDHIQPAPPEDSIISLSVSALARHPLGDQSAQAFVAVLSYIAERWSLEPRDPTQVVTVTVSADEVAKALNHRHPQQFVLSVISLVQAEPVRGIRQVSPDPEAWSITVDRGIARYRNLTLDRYLELVEADLRSAPSSWQQSLELVSPPAPPTRVQSMEPERAIRELQKLKQESESSGVQREGPAHGQWKAKVRAVLERSLGPDASVLRDFSEVRYDIGFHTGAPGEAEENQRYFAQQVESAAAYIEAAIFELELSIAPEESLRESPTATTPEAESAIFLVHGHDGGAKYEIARFLEQIVGRPPIILDEQANAGSTLVEKFERYANTSSYAVVLLTPDDVGRVKGAPFEADGPRARQNVVFELGYFFGKLGRKHVAVINAGVEKPSDVDGLVYISFPQSNWKLQLATELREAGMRIDPERLLR